MVRILVVDDDEDGRLLLSDALETKGYTVETATDGLDALERIKGVQPDVVISDILMPRLDGFALCRVLKSDPRTRHIPIVFYTASYVNPQDEALAMDLGASRFIMKPMEIDRLCQIIEKTLKEQHEPTPTISAKPYRGETTFQGMREESLLRKLDQKLHELAQSREALHQTEARYHSVVNTAHEGIWLIDQDADTVFVNPRMAEMLGYREEDMLGHSLFDFMDAEAVQRAKAGFEKRKRGIGEQHEFRFRRKDGSILWTLVAANPLFDKQGQFQGSLGMFMDITEQKHTEEQLRKLNRIYIVLSACNHALVHIQDERELFNTFCRHIVERGGYRLAWVGMIDGDETRRLTAVARAGYEDGYVMLVINTWNNSRERGPIGTALRTGKSVVVQDIHTDPGYAPWRMEAEKRGYAAKIVLPLKKNDQIHGVLNIYSERSQAFDTEEIKLLEELADDLDFGIRALQSATARRKSEEALRLHNRAVESSSDGIVIFEVSDDNPVMYVNPAFTRITGYEFKDVVGESARFIWEDSDQEEMPESLRVALSKRQEGHEIVHGRRKDGSVFWNETWIAPVQDERGIVTHYVGVVKDVTERVRYEQQLEHQANHDELTGLANRNLLQDRLRQALLAADRYRRLIAVLFLDLDRFKRVNDSLGHTVGDQLLQGIGQRLVRCVRESDTVAHWSGDEFVLLLTEIENEDDVTRVIRDLFKTVSQPMLLDDHEVTITCSIGISVYPRDGLDAVTLLKNADVATHRAKEVGRNTFQFYRTEMNDRTLERLSLEGDLRRALERGEFLLYYQPKIALENGEITGLEALLRWRHPLRGMVSPADFIPLAEETGLIVPIGEWVLRDACRQSKAWQTEGLPPIPVAVNLSTRQFMQPNLTVMVSEILREIALNPHCLELEITESLLMTDVDLAMTTLANLKAMGLSIAIDDFGTGYSSLSYLKRFPIDALKIDQSFVRDITTDPDDAAIVLAVIAMAHSLKLKVIAEGVETESHMNFLRAKRCDEMQGYFFSRPLPAAAFTTLYWQHSTPWPTSGFEDGQRTLLLIEPDLDDSALLSEALQAEGYRVLTANRANDAFTILAGNEVGVVLMEQMIPEGNGSQFLAKVRELYPEIVRIVLTARVDMAALVDAVNEGGIYKFLHKPVPFDVLKTTLREAFLVYQRHKAMALPLEIQLPIPKRNPDE